MKQWRLRLANNKVKEQATLLFADKEVKAECQRILTLLRQEDNPAEPENSELSVTHLAHDARHWYRLRVDDFHLRVIFSLVFIHKERLIEYGYGELHYDDAENYIAVQFMDYRAKDTYEEVRRLWRETH